VVGDSQRKQYRPLPIELALKSAHQRCVWRGASRERLSFARAQPPRDLETRPAGWSTAWIVLLAGTRMVAVPSADQELADLGGHPNGCRLVAATISARSAAAQLVGVANRPARAVGQCLETGFL